jgi:hypothetical protein
MKTTLRSRFSALELGRGCSRRRLTYWVPTSHPSTGKELNVQPRGSDSSSLRLELCVYYTQWV